MDGERKRIDPRDGVRYYFDDFFVGEGVEVVLNNGGGILTGTVSKVNARNRNGSSCIEIMVTERESKHKYKQRFVNYIDIKEAYQLI